MMCIRITIFAAMLWLPPAIEAADDPFVGRWSLDVQRSRYPHGGRPQEMTIEIVREGQRIHYHSETRRPDGRSDSADYTAAYDGKPAIVVGSHGILLPVALERKAANTVVATYVRGFEIMATSRSVVSPDGRVMTITTTSRNAAGKSVSNVGVYTRTKPAATRESVPAQTSIFPLPVPTTRSVPYSMKARTFGLCKRWEVCEIQSSTTSPAPQVTNSPFCSRLSMMDCGAKPRRHRQRWHRGPSVAKKDAGRVVTRR